MTKNSVPQCNSISSDGIKSSGSIRPIPRWLAVTVSLGALLLLAGAMISKLSPTLLTNSSPITASAQVYADYMFARNLPLAVMLLVLLAIKSRRMLGGFMVLIAFIQLVDVTNDAMRGAWLLIPGLLLFAVVFLIGAWKLFGQAIWHLDAWCDQERNTA